MVMLVVVLAGSAFAHGGDEHAAAPAAAQDDHVRSAVTRTGGMDVVLRWHAEELGEPVPLQLLLSNVAGNAPIEGASVTLHVVLPNGVGGPEVSLVPEARPGHYRGEMTATLVGEYAGSLTVVVGDRIESVALNKMMMGPMPTEHHHEDGSRPWPMIAIIIVVVMLIIAAVWWRRRSSMVIGLIALAATPVLAHGDDHDDHATTPAAPVSAASSDVFLAKESQFLLGIRTAEVARATMDDELLVAGRVMAPPTGQAAIVAPQPGRVMIGNSPPVMLGSVLKKGALLAIFEASLNVGERADFSIAAAQADGEVAAAEMALQAATKRLQRLASLGDVVSQRQRDDAEVEVSANNAMVAAARAKRDAYGADAHPTRVVMRAPMDGVVADVNVSPGELMAPGHRLFLIIDPRELWIEARVPEANLAMVDHPASITIEADARPGAVIQAKLLAVADVVDEASRTIKIIVGIDNRDRLLKVGMFAKVRMGGGNNIDTLIVPRTAVWTVDGQATVFVHTAPERFERRVVGLGRGDLQTVEVSGVVAGEHVAIAGLLSLQHAPAAP
jgi:membrane fusion protein, heavy metal efflux system